MEMEMPLQNASNQCFKRITIKRQNVYFKYVSIAKDFDATHTQIQIMNNDFVNLNGVCLQSTTLLWLDVNHTLMNQTNESFLC